MLARNSTTTTVQPRSARARVKSVSRKPPPRRVLLLVATRKGAWLFHGDAARRTWRVDGPHFLGHIVNHLVLDPRDGRTLLAAAKTGHLGPTIFRSTDLGRTWKEAAQPPAFAKAAEGQKGRAVDHTFWLTPGHAQRTERLVRRHLAAGPVPLRRRRRHLGAVLRTSTTIRSTASGWARVQDGTPDGPKLHSIIVDPRDPEHLYFAMSGGGVHESVDGGADLRAAGARAWTSSRVSTAPTSTFHDPHCVRMCPSNPDRLYQQNHCGIYRLDRPVDEWVRIGRNMPKQVGDIGFPMVRAPARRRHRVGVSDGWHHGVAAHQPGRQAGRLCQRATAARPGNVSMPACRASRRGGR